MSARRVLLAAVASAALLPSGCKKSEPIEWLSAPPTAEATALPHHWKLPEFALTERSGRAVRLADLMGKVWVADFFYTTCPGPCPMLTSRLSDVQKRTAAEPDVRLVSISVDPEKDTPAVLQSYAERFQAGAHWLFLTGPKSDIRQLARDGFKLPIAEATATEPVIHTTRLILIDRAGFVRGFYEGTGEKGVQDLTADIHRLLEEK